MPSHEKRAEVSFNDNTENVADIYKEMLGLCRLWDKRSARMNIAMSYTLMLDGKPDSGFIKQDPLAIMTFFRQKFLEIPVGWQDYVERRIVPRRKVNSYEITIRESNGEHYKNAVIKYNINNVDERRLNDLMS